MMGRIINLIKANEKHLCISIAYCLLVSGVIATQMDPGGKDLSGFLYAIIAASWGIILIVALFLGLYKLGVLILGLYSRSILDESPLLIYMMYVVSLMIGILIYNEIMLKISRFVTRKFNEIISLQFARIVLHLSGLIPMVLWFSGNASFRHEHLRYFSMIAGAVGLAITLIYYLIDADTTRTAKKT